MTTLIIARHGNTFDTGDIPTRVGGRTDLPLVKKGEAQAVAIGKYIRKNNLIPDVVYSSTLKRTYETARIAIKDSGINNPIYQLDIFNEIDYGPDENKIESDVVARIGADAIKAWDTDAIVPEGWQVKPKDIIRNWIEFGAQISAHDDDETVLVVTSNGIARFAPYMTGNFEAFKASHSLKLATGALAIFQHIEGKWVIKDWNIQP